MIIGIMGFIGSGKDTVADYLANIHQFRRESFASTLKDSVAAVFGWDRTLLEGRTRQSREWREQVDPWWANRLNLPHLTPRWVLQQWGTEVVRKSFHDDTWIASLENKIRKITDDVVISDCRFVNEIQAIRNQGGIVVRVTRGEVPPWYNWAVEHNNSAIMRRGEMMRTADQEESPIKYKIHLSEWAWAGTKFDHVFDNNGLLDDLYKSINDLVLSLSHPVSTVNPAT
ncbi:hypothetical protein UFOVP1146_20 [uncultured Caudovirales phage]|uniref:Deoxynucleoside monophosphate kinase n=1 Tax=uncultured Caudovirales phage TaxID=2100421 RepID=A0A6J5P6Q6_9CAUD|nr:hypothetical protein UFOVP812_353 [uncultured Caudovirales phage]CAB4165676.1 hypothetical protein UFOVP818_212 [uncultured Caudovirales phage]CAB4186656.1 hypothetical protein UFOVP1146_20 [uncultured Caudovirales phage]CAB4221022.1 hypothetical protein UFOVP1638_125 [uncultured Caudovirales phage]